MYHPYTKRDAMQVNHLEINIGQVRKLGGDYIISAVKINNSEQLSLSLVNTFEDPASSYLLYLYQVL
jgi:hypothetical protein